MDENERKERATVNSVFSFSFCFHSYRIAHFLLEGILFIEINVEPFVETGITKTNFD